MTHHGTPLKRMGLDLRDTPDRQGRGWTSTRCCGRCARWDYSISSNPFSTARLGAGLPRRLRVARGRLPAQRRARQRRRATTVAARPRRRSASSRASTAVLYAPTHREYQHGYVPMLDLAAAGRRRSGRTTSSWPGCTTSTTPTRSCASCTGAGRLLDVAAHPSVEELCLAADVLRDRLLLAHVRLRRARPPDRHPRARLGGLPRPLRGTYFDLLAEPPGAVTRTEDELIEALRSARAGAGRAARAAFRARFCALEDGRAAERVVRRVWLGRARRAPAGRSSMSDGATPLVLVVGVGRSGTSLLAGILGQLGFHIPQPEVQADDTNPRGFGEPRWVVDFHTRLLRARRVTRQRRAARRLGADGRGRRRPARCATSCATWLRGQLGQADAVVSRTRARSGSCRCGRAARRSSASPTVVRDDAAPSRPRSSPARASPTATGRRRRAAPRPGST